MAVDLNDIISMGTKMFQDKVGEDGVDSNALQDALSGLLSNEEGGFDLSNIMSSLTGGSDDGEGGGLASIVSSWIGGGDNESIDGDMLSNLLGSDKISEFADKLGIDTDTALSGLTDVIPNVVDKATPEGDSLLDQVGGLDGLMGMAGKLFGKS
jgi:uncharacterized protein YidB (DUF937 family)